MQHLRLIGLVAALLALAAGARPASAQDCRAITDIGERLICSDPALRDADNAMIAELNRFGQPLDHQRQIELVNAQLAWQQLRSRACDVRHAWGERSQTACLIAMTERRRAAFAAGRIQGELIVAEDGAPPLTVDTLVVSSSPGCAIVLRLPQLDPAQPGIAAFTAAVNRIAIGPGTADARRCPTRGRGTAIQDYDLDFRVSWQSPHIIAVTFEEYVDSGNAHPIVRVSALTFDLTAGRALTLSDLAAEPGRTAIAASCRHMMTGAAAHAIDAARLAAIAGDLSAWTVAPTQVTITFNPDTIVRGPGPRLSCTLPLATLRPFLRQDNPLW
jgi:uncharacterized protein YecT (DUF1311 family)